VGRPDELPDLLDDEQKIQHGKGHHSRGHIRNDGDDLTLQAVQELFQPAVPAYTATGLKSSMGISGQMLMKACSIARYSPAFKSAIVLLSHFDRRSQPDEVLVE